MSELGLQEWIDVKVLMNSIMLLTVFWWGYCFGKWRASK